MKVLLIGGGGREHALAYALHASPALTSLFIAPGNPGTAKLGQNIALQMEDQPGILAFCKKEAVDLVVVGPEAPLVAGLADALEGAGIRVFGPKKAAAQLEGSKDFTKSVAIAAGVPTARYATVTSLEAAKAHLAKVGAPIVVKYDGLMAGKGVTVAETLAEAEAALHALYTNEPSAKVVLEERLIGEEISFFCLVDGETVLPFGSAQDHKRAYDGDCGPNTGGMGAYAPAPAFTPALEAMALARIIRPTAREMVRRGAPYRGILFAGLMLTAEGPKLIEYNCRFGDPECQVLMLRLKSDLLPLLDAVARGALHQTDIAFHHGSAIGVVMASKGYPGAYQKGSLIRGLAAVEAMEGVTMFHAGTRQAGAEILAEGGRVLTVCARGDTLRIAQVRAYAAIERLDWPQGFCRSDIGARGVMHESALENI